MHKLAGIISGRSFLLPILAAGFLFDSCGGPTTHEVCGTVLAAEGSVEINGQRASPHSIRSRPDLCAGAILRTFPRAKVQIACLPNALIHIAENTAFKIQSLTLRKDGNETDDGIEARAARCRLVSGAIDLSHWGTEGVAEFVTSTPHGTVIAKFNCVVRVAVDDKKTRITCASGRVMFVPIGGSPLMVEAGFVTEWPSNTPITAAAAESASDQQALTDAFEMGQRLESLLKARSAALPWNFH